MKNRVVNNLLGLLMLVGGAAAGQSVSDELANEYYKKEEYAKAAVEYAKVLKEKTSWPVGFRYVNSLLKTKRDEEALKFLKKQTRSDEVNAPIFEVLTGMVYNQQGDTTETQKHFQAGLDLAKKSQAKLEQVTIAFNDIGESRWAIKALEMARTQSGNPNAYNEELSKLYRGTGQTEKWINELISLNRQIDKKEVVLAGLQGLINSKEEELLEKVLYSRIQQEPMELGHSELLTWYFVQKQKFSRALLQEKATDKRLKLNGSRVYDLGVIALNNKEYKTAADAFDYVATTYPQGQLYAFARRMVINAREEQVKNTYPVDKSEIRKLITDYQKMLQEVGTSAKTLEALRSTANLYANYLDEKDTALTVLDLTINLSKGDKNFIDRCKIDKGDVYLLKAEPWEATLLYAQVEKSQKEEPLGHEAKLKNAKLHYYSGNFAVAKDILDILKLATSREIANDAGSLSLLILDNTGLDSNETALREYAAIELMLFQNKTEEAVDNLSEMLKKYQNHMLADEILWLRANTYFKQGKTDEGLEDLKQLLSQYAQDILGDDALFLQAKIIEERKKDKAAAMALYQKLLTDYPASIYGAEARKRFRALRGDVLN